MVGNLPGVLVVDDQKGIRKTMEYIIKEVGYSVYLAKNGLEAIELVHKVRPQIVFLDVKMPVMGGLEALEKIKAISPQTKVIMMTAYISDYIINKSKEKGALCCISKPFKVKEIKFFLKNNYINNI